MCHIVNLFLVGRNVASVAYAYLFNRNLLDVLITAAESQAAGSACCSGLDFEPVVSKYQDAVIATFSRFNSMDTTAGNAGGLRLGYFEDEL
ncbi:hypothetical protein [Lentilactobacillus buchneri]|uniref:hypothetical protein n=1 Tax=Lentilactobacillus buchneri TaxID=1581 RepID=UPI001CDC5057|nr:hypothetical protein [Lentilactobacillus buchneri]